MGNAESDLKNDGEVVQGSNGIRLLTEEEFTKLSIERQREYMAAYTKYNQRKKKEEREQIKRERRQRSVETINAIKNRFAKNSPEGYAPQHVNNFEYQLKAPLQNSGNSQHRQHKPRYGPQFDTSSSSSTAKRNQNQIPPSANIIQSQILDPHSHPQTNSTSYPNSYVQSQSNANPQFQEEYYDDPRITKQYRGIQHSHQNEANGQTLSKSPNHTANNMMYLSQPTNGSTAKSMIDPIKMMQSIKIEENDWETRWENDNNDDDDSDEEKVQSASVENPVSVATHHPFRPGLDLGHSSAAPKLRPSKQLIIQNSISASHQSKDSADHLSPTQSLSPNSQKEKSKSQWDDLDEEVLEDRPGVKMFSMLRVLGKGSFGKVRLHVITLDFFSYLHFHCMCGQRT